MEGYDPERHHCRSIRLGTYDYAEPGAYFRDERALNHIRRYIIENPQRWAQDRENPAATAPEAPDAWQIR